MGISTLRFGARAVLAFVTVLAIAQPTPQALRASVSLPTKDWGVSLELPGYRLKTMETKRDGRRYMVTENQKTNVVVSITLEQTREGKAASSCRESLEQKTTHTPVKIQDVRFSRSGDLEVMRYMVPEFQGQRVNQESLFGCQFYDGTYIDLHVSKVNYAATDEPLFQEVLNAIEIVKGQRSSTELFDEASRLYLQHDYNGAIGPYAQALELEKVNPTLEKPLWYVLIDNLGISYGITGNLEKAKETFEYGVSKDAKYPLFYYNLACTYAEMNDATSATEYLKKAFDYKTNVLPGESMPDPRQDDSFENLMKDRQFRELAERLAKSR